MEGPGNGLLVLLFSTDPLKWGWGFSIIRGHAAINWCQLFCLTALNKVYISFRPALNRV